MTSLTRFQADACVQRVMTVLNPVPHTTRIVGGAVRDALLNRPLADVDFATKLVPEEVMERCAAAGLRTLPTGIEFGTVTVLADQRPFEVTTLRRDVASDGRRAVVAFGMDWTEDARRRDFTINALYCDAEGVVHAPLGGLEDLAACRVRFIGDADARLQEDYLRIWRFFRFSATYADEVDAVGLAACVRQRSGMAQLSAERVKQELFKLLIAPRAAAALQAMADCGLAQNSLGVVNLPRFKNICACDCTDALLRLAALALWTQDDVPRLLRSLRLSRADSRALALLMQAFERWRCVSSHHEARVMFYRFSAVYERSLILARAMPWGVPLADFARTPQTDSVPVLPVNGRDLLARGHKPGEALGAALRALEQKWIESDFTLTKPQLLGD